MMRKKKILVIDDSPTQLVALKMQLQKAGYEVVTATNGVEGINRTYMELPTLIVSDIVMPEINGYQLCRLLKNDPLTSGTPIILLTGLDQQQDRFWGLKAGADSYVGKEQKDELLLSEIERLLEESREKSSYVVSKTYVMEEEVEPAGIKSRVNYLLDKLLFEATLSVEVRKLSERAYDRRRFLEGFFELLLSIVDFSAAGLVIVDEEGGNLHLHSQKSLIQGELEQIAAEVTEMMGLERLSGIDFPGQLEDGQGAMLPAYVNLFLPLEIYGERVGAIYLYRHSDQPYSERTFNLLASIREELAMILKLLLLYEQVNRRNQELSRSNESLRLANLKLEAANNSIIEEKNKVAAIVENLADGVITIEPGMDLASLNPRARAMAQTDSPAVMGTFCGSVMKSAICGAPCPMEKALKEGVPLSARGSHGDFETEIPGPDDSRIPVMLTSILLRDVSGRITGGLEVFRDITLQKEIEQMKDDFLAIITHDLKSPLTAIIGYTQLLKAKEMATDVGDDCRAYLNSILRASKTLLGLVNNLLTGARIDAGKLSFEMADFDLVELCRELEEMFRPLLEERRIQLKGTYPEQLMVYGDREAIWQVISNLLSNAIKATPGNGQIELVVAERGGRARIELSDTGKGIPEADQERLFSKFAKGTGERTGTGLGLYIVSKVLQGHGSDIILESQVGKGSKFTFELPREAF